MPKHQPSDRPKTPIQLEVTTLVSAQGDLQTLAITLSQPKQLIRASDIASLTLPPQLDLSREVVLFGQAPTWLYGRLVHLCHKAPWIACYNAPARQSIVVHSRVAQPTVGDAISVQLNRQPCPAILIGGPPNSGKSVFSNALRKALLQSSPNRRLFLYRASWDGEGNWAYESPDDELVDRLVQRNEYRIHEHPETRPLIPDFFKYHARAVENLRSLTDIVLVDVGGMPQPEKQPLLEQCTHYIIISRLASAIEVWHQFCQPLLNPVGVIHSVLERRVEVLKAQPFLEMVAGPWVEGDSAQVSESMVNAVLELEN